MESLRYDGLVAVPKVFTGPQFFCSRLESVCEKKDGVFGLIWRTANDMPGLVQSALLSMPPVNNRKRDDLFTRASLKLLQKTVDGVDQATAE